MGSLFSKPKMPPPPKPVRMPIPEDTKEQGLLHRRAMARRKGRGSTSLLHRRAMARRKGRGSTIMTETLGDTQSTGSSGQTLGK
jgi:hypothetical protein